MPIRKIKASFVNQELNEYVGEYSYIFYDVATGELRIWDGTPGGAPLLGGGGGTWGSITGNVLDQTDLINYISTTSGDDNFIRTFIGKDAAGSEVPVYTSATQITQNAPLDQTIGELDLAIGVDLVGNSIITTADSSNSAIQDIADFLEVNAQEIVNTSITTITTVDSVVAETAKWIIRIEEVATPTNVYTTELIATHNGTDIDSAKYAILKLGSNISGLDVTATLTGGNTLNINVESASAVNVMIKRIMAV